MEKRINIIAKNQEEALQKAVLELHMPSDKIFVNLVEETPEGLVYEALVDINLTLEGKRYLDNILKNFQLNYQIEARSVNNEKELHYVIESVENSLLIGLHGKNLEAFQTLLRSVISLYTDERSVVSLDIGSYKAGRAIKLEILATSVAKDVVRTKIPAKLRPMNSFERRVIHEKLSSWRDVYTESEGEGAQRAIVIKPKL